MQKVQKWILIFVRWGKRIQHKCFTADFRWGYRRSGSQSSTQSKAYQNELSSLTGRVRGENYIRCPKDQMESTFTLLYNASTTRNHSVIFYCLIENNNNQHVLQKEKRLLACDWSLAAWVKQMEVQKIWINAFKRDGFKRSTGI